MEAAAACALQHQAVGLLPFVCSQSTMQSHIVSLRALSAAVARLHQGCVIGFGNSDLHIGTGILTACGHTCLRGVNQQRQDNAGEFWGRHWPPGGTTIYQVVPSGSMHVPEAGQPAAGSIKQLSMSLSPRVLKGPQNPCIWPFTSF